MQFFSEKGKAILRKVEAREEGKMTRGKAGLSQAAFPLSCNS